MMGGARVLVCTHMHVCGTHTGKDLMAPLCGWSGICIFPGVVSRSFLSAAFTRNSLLS